MFGGGDAPTNHRYSLIISASVRNALNHVNLAPPIGNLSSPLFGQSNGIAAFGSATANRRIELQMRLMF